MSSRKALSKTDNKKVSQKRNHSYLSIKREKCPTSEVDNAYVVNATLSGAVNEVITTRRRNVMARQDLPPT